MGAPIYRPCVGVMLVNREGLVFVGRRRNKALREHVDATHEWQMPQGGIDDGEDPYQACLRELYEETNVRSVSLIAEAPDWYHYDLPDDIAREAWLVVTRVRHRNGMPCVLKATTTRSIFTNRQAGRTSLNLMPGGGSLFITFLI